MNHWWRAYNEAVNDPKLQLISDSLFRAWFNLMCIASANDGALPALADIAFTLRMKSEKAAQVLTQLHKAGLLDKTETGFAPHNWNGRQYKTDANDPTAASRSKRYRDRRRDASRRDGRDEAVTDKRPDTEDREQKEDRIGDAGARVSSFTEGSKILSSALWKALGFKSPLEIPPELAGADWRAIEWEKSGWTADLIDAQARRIGPGKPLNYYEKVFATEFAKRQAPLPIVEIQQAEKLTVTNYGTTQAKPGVAEIARRNAEYFESQSGDRLAGDPNALLRLSAR